MTAYEMYTEDYLKSILVSDASLDSYGGIHRALKSGSEVATIRIFDPETTSHIIRSVLEDFGVVSFSSEGENLHYLEDQFHNPFSPTQNECILFEIEHGFKYPLLKFLKEEPR